VDPDNGIEYLADSDNDSESLDNYDLEYLADLDNGI